VQNLTFYEFFFQEAWPSFLNDTVMSDPDPTDQVILDLYPDPTCHVITDPDADG